MAHFAKLGENDVVTEVLVIDQGEVDSGRFGNPTAFVQTSYNTRGGVHYDPNTNQPSTDQSKALRKNFAGIGFKYDRSLDAFIAPKPFASWLLNTNTCEWEAPTPMPQDGKPYQWDEETLSWKEVVLAAA